ncbi:MAG: AAA family ATPase [Chloroflexi bacterium]|nr:AAA family ATPase [Chloroflexota bacterium]
MLCPRCGRENPDDASFCNGCASPLSAPDSPVLDALARGLSPGFVGRRRELAALVAALDDALAGQPRLVMLVGEPGIGKTRTAQELASIAEERRAQVFWGRCHEGEGAPPYWPWLQVLRAFVEQADSEALQSQMGNGAADIAEICPQLHGKLPGMKPPPQLEPEQARFRLFDSITLFLKRASAQQPIVLVFDNLHWADASSLRLLEFAAQELSESRLLVLGTYRDVDVLRGHPLYRALGELARLQNFQRVLLRGLSEEEVGGVIERIGGVRPTASLAALVHRETEGNPLFVGEVARLLSQEGKLEAGDVDDLDFRLPEGVREVIGRRLDRLSQECNEALRVASVIGREFSIQQLERLVEMDGDRLLAALDEVVAARIVEGLPRSVGRYQFHHALIRQTLESELATTRRVRLHARIVEVFEELYADDLEAHADELARHAAEAEAVIGHEKLVLYSAMAGEQALAAYAWEDAITHFQRGLAANEGQQMDAETAAIASCLGRSLAALGHHEQAATHLERAFAYYAEVGDVTRALATVEHPYASHLLIQLKDTLFQALELVPADSLESARLLCSYGLSVGVRGNGYAQGQDALEASLAIARREEDVALERRVMAVFAIVDGYHMKWQQCLEKSLCALELAAQVNDPTDEQRALGWAFNSLFTTGDPKRAEGHLAKMFVSSEALRNVFNLEVALSRRHILAYLSGQWEALHALGDRHTNDLTYGVLAMALYQTGDFNKGKAYMDMVTGPVIRIDPSRSLWSLVAACFCYISGETDLLTEVEAAASDVIANPELSPVVALDAQAALAQVAILRCETSTAAEQYAALKLRYNTVTWTGATSIDRLLGLLAKTIGKLDTAQRHFEDALSFCRKAGYRPELAWACYDYADLLHQQGQRQKAMSLLKEALAITTELGMKPLMDKVSTRIEQVERASSKAPARPDGLTGREVEVLRLIALGKTDHQIAQELVISDRTVNTHVRNILHKTLAANRTEAASYATRRGLA